MFTIINIYQDTLSISSFCIFICHIVNSHHHTPFLKKKHKKNPNIHKTKTYKSESVKFVLMSNLQDIITVEDVKFAFTEWTIIVSG